MQIRVDDLSGPEIAALLQEHIDDMRAVSPPESKHALDLASLKRPQITLWTGWLGTRLAGCGALMQLDPTHGEVKSMRTARDLRRLGVAAMMLEHIIQEAKRRGYRRLSLETGSMPFFEPARRLYARFGFEVCGPFSSYRDDPNSAFFTKVIVPPKAN
jgi:putative acetyltransferase